MNHSSDPLRPRQPDSTQKAQNPADRAGRVRLIAFYLPQFHPIPENDRWWGKGFTEWFNVTRARPLFRGHYQPHLPADLGFYDLRLREARLEQIELAKQYGIDGFCYYYYWFSGKRLLHRPVDEMLADRESDMPFCLCWANENWTRKWDASEHEILMGQQYLPDDDINFIQGLVPFFNDPRYIRVEGAPFLIVYRPQELPNPAKTVSIWREYCTGIGIGDIHLCAALTHGNRDYRQFDFDSGVEFPPHNLEEVFPVTSKLDFYQSFQGHVYKHDAVARGYLERRYDHANVFRTVFPSWDNTARLGARGVVILNGTPENYQCWLAETIRKTRDDFPGKDRFVFVNAWNEWAEGCHLEPDREYGRQFLEATVRAKEDVSERRDFPDTALPRTPHRSIWVDMKEVAQYHVESSLRRARASVRSRPRLRKALRPLNRLLKR